MVGPGSEEPKAAILKQQTTVVEEQGNGHVLQFVARLEGPEGSGRSIDGIIVFEGRYRVIDSVRSIL